MKKIISVMAVAAFAVVASANPVIYVVDIMQVHQHYYKTKAAQEQVKSTIDYTNAEISNLEEQYKALVTEAQAIQEKANNPALAETAKKEIVEKELSPIVNKLRTIEQSIQGMRNQATQQLRKQESEIVAAHRKEIVEVIEKIAKDKKADFILEKRGTYFSKPTSDITEEVIAAVNAKAPKM